MVDNDAKETTGKTHTDNAGEAVKGIESIETYEYNVKGEKIRIDYNLDASEDDSVEKSEHLELDANGYAIKKFINLDGKTSTGKAQTVNGKAVEGIDQIEERDYTPHSYVKQIRYDFDANNTIDQIDYHVRDSNGYLTDVYKDLDAKSTTGKDFEKNGEKFEGIEAREEHLNNAKGELIRYSQDLNGDGVIDKINYDVRDKNGYLVGIHYDNDGNSNTGKTVTDVNGRVLQGIDTIEIFEVNPIGEVIKAETDNGANGSIDKVEYRVRDVYGRHIQTYTDTDNNESTGSEFELEDGRIVKCIEPLKLRNKRIIGIWRNFSGISETEVLKTGALRCIAPLFYVEKSKNNELRKNG